MGWLFLLGALIFPPVFILWRPRTPVPPARMKVRFAGAVVVVWMLLLLWSTRNSIASGKMDIEVERRETVEEVSETWQADAPADTPLIILLGWVPGLVYAGLLMLARKGLEPPAGGVIDDPRSSGHRMGGRGPFIS